MERLPAPMENARRGSACRIKASGVSDRWWSRWATPKKCSTWSIDLATRPVTASARIGVNFEQSTFDLTVAPGARQSLLHGQALARGAPQSVLSLDGAQIGR